MVLIVKLVVQKLGDRLEVREAMIGVPAQARMQQLGTRRLRAKLHGSAGPLHSPAKPGKFWFLLCRNVLDYFEDFIELFFIASFLFLIA